VLLPEVSGNEYERLARGDGGLNSEAVSS
jgi:hypothetical protein